MSATTILIGALVVFVFMRVVCQPKLEPGTEDWHEVLGPRTGDVALLAIVRYLGTFSLMVALGAGISVALTWWVESFDPAPLLSQDGQQTVDQIERLLAVFGVARLYLSHSAMLVGFAYMLLFGIGLLLYSAQSTRGVEKRFKAEIERLNQLGFSNKLRPIAPNEHMKKVDKAIAGARLANAESGIVEALFRRRFMYDVVRRLDPNLLREVGGRVPVSPLVGVFRFLFSSPLSRQVNRAGRVVAILAMITFVPASLVITSAELRAAIDHKQPKLKALQEALTLKLFLDAYAPLPGSPADGDETNPAGNEQKEDPENREFQSEHCDEGDETLPPEICVVIAEFGKAFETAWGASLFDRSGSELRDHAEEISAARRAWTRRQVLLESVASRAATMRVVETAPDRSQRRAWTHAVVDVELKARTGSGPATEFGKLASKIFASMVYRETGPVVIETIERPLTLRELAAPAVAAAVGWSINGVGLGGTQHAPLDSILSNILKEMTTQRAEDAIARSADSAGLHRAAELAALSAASRVRASRKTPRDAMRIDQETMQNVNAFVTPDLARRYEGEIDQVTKFEFPQRTEILAPPRVSLETVPSESIDWSKVRGALRSYRNDTGIGTFDSLASYSSVFPGIPGQRAQSREARVARALAADQASVSYGLPPTHLTGPAIGHTDPPTRAGGGLQTLKAAEITLIAKDHLDRARSFERLHGYQKVGGVLIGRNPDAATEVLNLVGVDFTIDDTPNKLTIQFTHANGRKTTVGPYDRSIAHLALAYAADGRPTTVTILPAHPLPDLKILLHPALVNTKAGCHAIRLDQFVDSFGSAGPLHDRRRTADEQRLIVNGLYRRAWAERWLARSRAQKHILEQWLEPYPERIADFIRSEEMPAIAGQFATAHSVLDDTYFPDESPMQLDLWEQLPLLRLREDVFDPQLVSILEACLIEENMDSSDSSTQCVVQQATRAGLNLNEEPTHYWHQTPQIFPTSGVREVPYGLDKDLKFAQIPRDIWEDPLRFVLLNTVIIERYAGRSLEFESSREAEPLELTELQDLLEQTVLKSARIDPDALRTLRVMQEFTVAQRLFRAAFDGYLGEQFPVERLVEIARGTANHVDFDTVRTDQWLLRGSHETTTRPPDAITELRKALGLPNAQEATCLGSDLSR